MGVSGPGHYYYFPGSGGGAYGCTLNNCTLAGNSAGDGGAAYRCTLNNCTLTGNSAFGGGNSGGRGGGAYQSTLGNCKLTGNSAGYGGGAYACTLNNCTVAGNQAHAYGYDEEGSYEYGSGGGAFGSTLNNCIVFNNTAAEDANYYSSTLNYSCSTPLPTNGVGNITNAPLFVNPAAGNYRLRPDSPCIDAGTNLSASITNDLDGRPRPLDGNGDGLAAFDMGAYEHRTPLLVWQDSPNPTPPHADWATAAHTIQDAVDAAVAGDEIVVTNGVYASGGWNGNRVAVDKALNVRSINGPQFTTIDGAVGRCVYLANGASLSGFTLTNGFAEGHGGGVLCESQTAVVSNCVVSGNWAGTEDLGVNPMGGGVYGGTLNNCTLSGNGAAYGGGAAYCTLNNCTLTGNSSSSPFSVGGGAYASRLNNCIVYFNKRGELLPPLVANYHSCTLNYSCTTPQPANGLGNITNAPLFVDLASGNLRLQSNSPCINAGLNAFAPAGPDLDANPRIVGGTVDIGAFEFQSLSLINFGVVSNQFGFSITGQSNWVIVLEASSDFTNWTPLTTNTLGARPFPFSDPTPPILPQRFYRARQL